MYKTKFKCIKRFLVSSLVVLLIASMAAVSVSAAQVPIDAYNYWTDTKSDSSRKSVYSRLAFEAESVIDAKSLNVPFYNEISDFCVDNGNIYILDGNDSRITIVDAGYNVIKDVYDVNYNGEALNYSGASGIFAKNGKIYICDTENERVLVMDESCNVISVIKRPTSSIIPDDFQYRPIKLTADSEGYLYILIEGSFYGAMLFTPSYEFVEFFGSNDVVNSLSTVFSNIISRVFPNNDKKAASVKTLPFSIVDLCMREDDFVYTVTGRTDYVSQKGQIRKLFIGTGSNILEYKGNFVDQKTNNSRLGGQNMLQDLCSIDVDESGFIYALDSKYGRIFVYDTPGSLITTFGGGLEYGEQAGTFKKAKTLALNGDKLLVLDSFKNTITVFKHNDYFNLIKQAQLLTLDGDYTASEGIWRQVLAQDSNCQIAYAGLARAEYAAGNYELAEEYARKGYDRDTYSLAFKVLRTQFITKYFWLIMTGAIVVIAALFVLLKIKKRKGIKLVKNPRVRLAMSALMHPIDTFNTIKEKRMTSVTISFVLLLIFYVTAVLKVLCGGFAFTYYDPASFNSIWVLVKSAGAVILWIAANWLVCSLMSGNGRITEIITVTCYSLIPLIINQIIQVIFTNVLLVDEAAFLSIISMVATILFVFMLATGTMIIHEYGFGKFVGTSVITVIGMAIIVFLIFMVVMLVQQLFGFISTIILEIATF